MHPENPMTLPREILEESPQLFREVRRSDVDPAAHADFVIARVLDLGTMRSVKALLRFYGIDRIRAFFEQGESAHVSCRTLPRWAANLGLTRDACTPRSSRRRRSPFWTA